MAAPPPVNVADGKGIAQYTSDPVLRRLVEEKIARNELGAKARIRPATIRTPLDMTRNYPGGSLRSPVPRASVDTFLDVFSRATLTWENLVRLRERTTLPRR